MSDKPKSLTPNEETAYHLEVTLRGVREGNAYALATARRWLASGQMLAALEDASDALKHMDTTAFAIGLTGTSDWDQLAGGCDLYNVLTDLQKAIAAAKEPTP